MKPLQSRLLISFLAITLSMTVMNAIVIRIVATNHFRSFLNGQTRHTEIITMLVRHLTIALSQTLISMAIVIVILTFAISWWLSKRLTYPLRTLIEQAEALAKGHFFHNSNPSNSHNEITYLSSTLNHMSQQLAQQANLRERLIQDISHELRTPLTALKASLAAIIDGVWMPTPERFALLMAEVTRFEKMVLDLERSMIQTQPTMRAKVPVNISNCLHLAIEHVKAIIEEKKIIFHVGILPVDQYVLTDADQLLQVFVNLLDNAYKYTLPHHSIEVKVEVTSRDIKTTIRDTGIGIPMKDLPYICERFYRVESSRDRKTGGTGLGLAIAKEIIIDSNGSLQIESQLGIGTIATVILPKVLSTFVSFS
ncbi:sensor histidine kinase [Ferroacidibacillus organovorans]|uniref:histidine kinase n=1 Tax=Ferroacidibacillus organovorans TaxID=1765683 RepID=A0A101XTE7_9BACL|nr:ATP-binding protein [Ferroacidibacillus organovorans]KUO97262.1 hypothetical protein ATW55_11765 [Ferroacidibacillus organovorans]